MSEVKRACHALALDDERNTFHPVLWNEEHSPDKNRIQDERITQVWFCGMHSNVGGGYPDDALAYVSLDWIMGMAALIIVVSTSAAVNVMVVLYSINVFITFTLSQLGMVRHWWLERANMPTWK